MKERAIQSTSSLIAKAKSSLSLGVIIFNFNFVSGIFNPFLLEISPPAVTEHLILSLLVDLTTSLILPSLTRSLCPLEID